jgi:hypothetical protein
MFRRKIISAALVVALLAPSAAAADDVFLVSPRVMEFFNGEYKKLKPPRAIAVSADGYHIGYSACPDYRCYMFPSARDLAMQACLSAGGQGCRLFAVDDDIQVEYRVMDIATRTEPTPVLPKDGPARLAQPCANRTQAQCERIAADFAARRRQIEEKWAKTIEDQRRYACGMASSAPCMIAKQAEADRNAELSALDADLQQQLTMQ